MKKITHLIPLVAVCLALTSATADAATRSAQDKQFLAGYEKAHTALAADDLSGAKTAARDLGVEGAELSKTSSLKDAPAGIRETRGEEDPINWVKVFIAAIVVALIARELFLWLARH